MNNDIPHCRHCPVLQSTIFADCSPEELEELSTMRTPIRAQGSQVLFGRGDRVDGLYCLQSGLVILDRNGRDGIEPVLHFATPGEALGLPDLFQSHYARTAVAAVDSRLCFVHVEAIRSFWHRSPSMRLNTIRRLTKRLALAEDCLE